MAPEPAPRTAAPAYAAPPPVVLMQMLTGLWSAQAIQVAARLGVADHLAAGPRSVEDLARATHTHAPTLHRLLRALASVGVLDEPAPGRYALTPIGAALQSTAPGSVRDLAVMSGDEWHWRAWGALLESVRTGQSAFEASHGKPLYDWFTDHPDAADSFHRGLASLSAATNAVVPRSVAFSRFRTVVDVGAGHGGLSAALLRAHPALRAVLVDHPSVLEGARSALAAQGLAARADFVGGDFFRDLPTGGDAYILKHILHNWDDGRAAEILGTCRRAMAPGAALLIVDAVVPAGREPHHAKLYDLEMLVLMPGGRERTEAEFRRLLEAAGFRLERVITTPTPFSVIEATPQGPA